MGGAAGVGGLDALDPAPVHAGVVATHGGFGSARHGRGFKLGAEFFERQATPQVGGGGVPRTGLLAADEAIGQAAHVVLPGGVVHHGQHQARGVHVAVLHQPPPVVVLLGAEDELGALERQARAQYLHRLGQAFVALGHIGHALQNIHPVNHRVRGPLVGRNGDAAEHAALGLAVARQRLDGGELAHVQVFARAPVVALDAAFHKRDQGALHRRTGLVWQSESGVDGGSLVRGGQQVGREGVAARVGIAAARREVAGQTVAVQIRGQVGHHGLPQLAVAQAHGLAGLLLQAAERVGRPPVAHAGQAPISRASQLGLQRHLQTAPAGDGVCGQRGIDGELAIHLHQRGLLHRERHGGHDALAGLERIGSARSGVARLDFPQDGFGTGLRELRGRRHIPRHFTRFTGGDVHLLGLEFQQRGTRCHFHLHGRLGGVAQRDLRTELVALAHQRRQAADDLQVLCGADAGAARAKQAGRRIGHCHDLEGGQRVVEGHRHLGLAVGIELHGGVPQQQRVEQLACLRTAAAAARRHRLLAIVAPADDFHLRGGSLHAPAAALQHGFEQVPAGVGHQLQQGLVHGGHGHFGVGCRLAAGQRGRDGDLGLAAHRVAFLVGRHLHIDLVGLFAHANFSQAQAEGGLGQIHQR